MKFYAGQISHKDIESGSGDLLFRDDRNTFHLKYHESLYYLVQTVCDTDMMVDVDGEVKDHVLTISSLRIRE